MYLNYVNKFHVVNTRIHGPFEIKNGLTFVNFVNYKLLWINLILITPSIFLINLFINNESIIDTIVKGEIIWGYENIKKINENLIISENHKTGIFGLLTFVYDNLITSVLYHHPSSNYHVLVDSQNRNFLSPHKPWVLFYHKIWHQHLYTCSSLCLCQKIYHS